MASPTASALPAGGRANGGLTIATSRKGTPLKPKIDPRLDVNHQAHKDYIQVVDAAEKYFCNASFGVFRRSVQWWDLFLSIQEDKRALDEKWRSDVFVPLPFSTSRTKAAQITELLGNVEPIWQIEATREASQWYEQAQSVERQLDYVCRMNSWRKLLYKIALARSVQGTAFLKVGYTRRQRLVTFHSGQAEIASLEFAIERAVSMGAYSPPDWRMDPLRFEEWRNLVNKSERFGRIPAAPLDGKHVSVEYEGPTMNYVPMWTVRMDPMVDEPSQQKIVMHRMVKPKSYVTSRMDDDPSSAKPYWKANVEEAMNGWDGKALEEEEQHLAEAMGLNPLHTEHPYFTNAVEILEVWSPEEPFQYSVVLNRKTVINKRPFEWPLLTSASNLFTIRNVIVPGHAYGLSDYQGPERLFRELNAFRRLRMDGAALATLPAFVKPEGLRLGEAMLKLRPGMVISAPGGAQALQSLIRHQLPPEAYREPAEIKAEIEDATEVYSSTKGAPATVGRVTGTEYQGRAGQTLLKYKVDASMIEEELADLPNVLLSLMAQLGPERLHREIGGDPDALVDITRQQLTQMLGVRFRLRGATRHVAADLQIQQVTTAMRQFQQVMTPIEQRAALALLLDMLDVRGTSKILTMKGEEETRRRMEAEAAQQAAESQTSVQANQRAQIPVPPTLGPAEQQALGVSGAGAQVTAPAPPAGGPAGGGGGAPAA